MNTDRDSSHRSLRTSRTFAAPPADVFAAIQAPERLAAELAGQAMP
ncbi:MAG: hypothetical protein IIA02_14250 [Proteobacteria bacterium]|nr:hypothetical protein [Pseudomonadota bacterium]